MNTTKADWTREFLASLIVAIAAAFLVFFYIKTQPPLTHGEGAGWDGRHYIHMAELMAEGQPLTENKPFIYRVGTPGLVALTKIMGWVDSLYRGFFAVNITFAVLDSILVGFLISRLTNRGFGIAGGICHALHWVSPARFVVFAPVSSDPGGLFFLYLGLIAIVLLRQRLNWLLAVLAIVVGIGLLFRDFVLILPIVLVISRLDLEKAKAVLREGAWREFLMPLMQFWPPFAAALGVMLLIRLNVQEDNSTGMMRYGFGKAALFHFWTNAPQYYLYALLTAFGPALVFPLLQYRIVWTWLKTQPALLAALLLIVLAAYVGGWDTERYLNWGFPLFFVIIMKGIEAENPPRLLVGLIMIFIVVFVCRLPWIIPDYTGAGSSPDPLFTFMTDEFALFDLFVMHSEKRITGRAFYQHVMLSGLVIMFLRRKYLIAKLSPMFGR